MKTHPDLYAWLVIIASYLIMIALVLILCYHRRIIRWVGEWCFVISEIWRGDGKRWQDEG